MGSATLAVRLILAAVFATAGVGKLIDQPGSRQALVDFGLGSRPARPVGLLLPLAELATAGSLCVHQSARWGAVAALLLLVAFIGAIGNALAHGQAPDCHCFGQLHSAPAGRSALGRNGGLAALAAFVAIHGPGPAIDGWVAARSASELAAVCLGIAAIAMAASAIRLWLDNRGLRRDLERAREVSAALPPGLPVGASAPGFSLPSLGGQTVTLDALRNRRRLIVLVFVSPDCGPCGALFPRLGRWQQSLSEELVIVPISAGSVRENRPLAEEHGIKEVLLQREWEVLEAYRAQATPSAVIVTNEGTIASPTAQTVAAIEPLIRLALRNASASGSAMSADDRPPLDVRTWAGSAAS